jgi:hypothetical protein
MREGDGLVFLAEKQWGMVCVLIHEFPAVGSFT